MKKVNQRNSINAIICSRIGEGDKEQGSIVNRNIKYDGDKKTHNLKGKWIQRLIYFIK